MIARPVSRIIVAAALAGAGLAACTGDSATVSPLSAPTTASQLADGGLKKDAAKPKSNSGNLFGGTPCSTRYTVTGSGVFGPSGGTLVFGTSSLIIPGGALRDTVTISATSLGGENSRVELLPHGLQFAKPAGLLLDTNGCDMDATTAPNVVYLSETGEVLQIIPAVYDPHWHTIAAPLDHFSGYAIAF